MSIVVRLLIVAAAAFFGWEFMMRIGHLIYLGLHTVVAAIIIPEYPASIEQLMTVTGWNFRLGIVSDIIALGLFFGLLIDRFPFGRYRLRFVPKDDPAPGVFS